MVKLDQKFEEERKQFMADLKSKEDALKDLKDQL